MRARARGAGAPSLLLDTGAATGEFRHAYYVSGEGTATLRFEYVVQPDDATDDLKLAHALALRYADSAGLTRGVEMSEEVGSGSGVPLMVRAFLPEDADEVTEGVFTAAPAALAANCTLPLGRAAPLGPGGARVRIGGGGGRRATALTTSHANGTFGAGEAVEILVHFSEPLVAADAEGARLALELVVDAGASGRNCSAAYIGGATIAQPIDVGVDAARPLASGGFRVATATRAA